MTASTREYLDPIFLSKLANMELVARCAVEGFFTGLHPSPFQGFSVEYSDHREYHAGDEIKFLDWKIFARSDRLYIKRFQQETNTTIYILLDVSRSMAFAGEGDVAKIDYASFLAAALSYLMLKQGDATGMVLFADRIVRQVPPASRRTHISPILTALDRQTVVGQTHLARILHTVAEVTKRRGLIVLISDLLDEGDVFQGLAHLKFLKHDVIVFHVMDHQELTLDYKGLIQFEDMESGDKVRAFPQSIQAGYRQRVGAFLNDVKTTLGNAGIDYCLLDTSQPLDHAFIAYLSKRRRMM